METNLEYKQARELLLSYVNPMGAVRVPLETERLVGSLLAEDVVAAEDVPPFDRSPYDGYAFRAADTVGADREHPVTLRILEEIPAGSMWSRTVTPGTAAKILTGAPVPPGADAVTKYEDTTFTGETVTVYASFSAGENVVPRGEDVRTGELLAEKGTVIDPALLGVLALGNVEQPWAVKAREGIRQALTMRIDLDDSLGELTFVRSLMPESALVFLNVSGGSGMSSPMDAAISHVWSELQPWTLFEGEGPVKSIGAGTVTAVSPLSGGQYGVLIDHGEGLESVYANLVEVNVSAGDAVNRGDVLGTASDTLYFELRQGGESVDPNERLGL